MKRLLAAACFCGLCCFIVLAQPTGVDTMPRKPATIKPQQPVAATQKEEKEDKDAVTKMDIVIAVVSSSLLTTILTLLGDAIMKRRIERNMKGDAEKVAKQIGAYEKIYEECLKLQEYDGTPTALQPLLNQIAFIQKYLRQNRLYIDDPLKKATLDLLDFYTSLSTHPTVRDVAVEAELFENIIILFKK